MPKGPSGQKRPADVTQNAVHVMRIATGEAQETKTTAKSAAAEHGSKGGNARAAALDEERRSNIAKTAAKKRWEKS